MEYACKSIGYKRKAYLGPEVELFEIKFATPAEYSTLEYNSMLRGDHC
jgi:hypothetical protein